MCYINMAHFITLLTQHHHHSIPKAFNSSFILNITDCFLQCIAAAMIIFTFIHEGRLHNLWGLFAGGIALGAAAVIGFFTGWTLRPAAKALFFWVLLGAWVLAMGVMIANAALLHKYMNNQCGAGDHSALPCQNIREYHIITYTAFGIPVALWVPTLIVGAYYLWRTSRLYRKEAAPAAPVVPVGSSTM
jgi:hypothetical protein